MEPGAPVPEHYRAHVGAICDMLRLVIAEKGACDPFIVLGSLTGNFDVPVYGISELPHEIGCMAITATAKRVNAEFVLICRTTIAANARTKEQAEAYAQQYSKPADVPGAQLVGFVSLETYDGVWVGVKPVEFVDGKATIGEIRLGRVDPVMPMLNLLPSRTPLQ
ncbi:hypothetical protein [Burkholderia reimsis]|uniref:hypothetical protein n=1 Tax=Burkholderia reimsis TaxID=2234132 RepID=UPI0010590EC9|nr:hypothetical protein [Burkholderia reimsis]